jgi:hypothetical protein
MEIEPLIDEGADVRPEARTARGGLRAGSGGRDLSHSVSAAARCSSDLAKSQTERQSGRSGSLRGVARRRFGLHDIF